VFVCISVWVTYIIGEKGCSCFREWDRSQGPRSRARVQVKIECVGDSSSMGERGGMGGERGGMGGERGGGRRSESFVEGTACTYQRQKEADRNRHMDRCTVAEGNREDNSVSSDTGTPAQAQAQTQTQTHTHKRGAGLAL
jgi:hypothetical protein